MAGTPDRELEIQAIVERCLAYAAKGDSPLTRAADFLVLVKTEAKLSDEEIDKVRLRVFDAIGERLRQHPS